jgi:hypothetical protein
VKSAGPERDGAFRAPLGSASCGRLVFTRGTSHLTIGADPATEDLYRASFEGPEPTVRMEASTVTIRYPRLRQFGRSCSERPGEVVLNARIPWRIEFGGGVSRLAADLSGLDLDSFEVEGGASRAELRLPKPLGSVAVNLLGGVNNVGIRRPEGVAARLRVSGGVTDLAFDEEHFGVVGGEVSLQSSHYESASDRYDISITGGANNLTVSSSAHPNYSVYVGGL